MVYSSMAYRITPPGKIRGKVQLPASKSISNRLLIVHEACQIGGFGAEIASIVVEKAFDYLDAPIVRLGAPDAPIPYNDELERQAIPSQERIIDKVREILA